jgi:hypothetical protein
MTVSSVHVGRASTPRIPRAESCPVWDAESTADSRGVAWNPVWDQHLSAALRDALVATYGRYVPIRPSQVWRAADPNCKPIAYFARSRMRREVISTIPHSSPRLP